jgi:hypothetical protein
MLASRCAATTQEKFALLNCGRLPARLNTSEVAVLLGFQEHDIAPLRGRKTIEAVGKVCGKFAEIFCGGGNCRAGIERGVAFKRDESTRETLASQKPAKAADGRLLSMTYSKLIFQGSKSVIFPGYCSLRYAARSDKKALR